MRLFTDPGLRPVEEPPVLFVRGGRSRGPERRYAWDRDGAAWVWARGRWRPLEDHLAAVIAGVVPTARRDWHRNPSE